MAYYNESQLSYFSSLHVRIVARAICSSSLELANSLLCVRGYFPDKQPQVDCDERGIELLSVSLVNEWSSFMATLDEARAAKPKLRAMIDPALQAGFGITGSGVGYALTINLRVKPPGITFPDEVDGVPVIVKVVGEVRASTS